MSSPDCDLMPLLIGERRGYSKDVRSVRSGVHQFKIEPAYFQRQIGVLLPPRTKTEDRPHVALQSFTKPLFMRIYNKTGESERGSRRSAGEE